MRPEELVRHLTAGLVRELAAYLASARSNPELRFR